MGAEEDIPPIETIYLNNLNERISKDELKKSLYAAFSQFGPILDVVALKTFKMRGQAFIVFRDIEAATTAVRQMQGFPFFEKPLKITYAKSKSDATAKLDGTYEARDKAARAAKRKAEREARDAAEAAKAAKPAEKKADNSSSSGAPAAPSAPSAPTPSAVPSKPGAPAGPNPILFVENLPEAVNDMMLSMLFQQFPGYKEVRLVPGKGGIAFVEFESEMQSGVAMNGLQGFKITPQNLMKISYAKR